MIKIFKRYLDSISDRLMLDLCIYHADGSVQRIGFGGPFVELHILDDDLYSRLVLNPSLGFGEGYASGTITVPTDNLFDLFRGYGEATIPPLIKRGYDCAADCIRRFLPGNTLARARRNAQQHYDRFHRIVRLVVDAQTRLYSCAFFKHDQLALWQAQVAKTDRTLAKLDLHQGQSVLEIGCGYGHIACEAARRFGVKVTGLTLSRQQHRVASEKARQEGLDVVFLEADYRGQQGHYDRVYSVAMYEAVGRKHWNHFFRRIAETLNPGGIFLLHTVTQKRWKQMNSFIDRHVFPGSELPTPRQVLAAAERNGFRLLHTESWKPHYSRTLLSWHANLRQAKEQVFSLYDDVREAAWYYRLWEVYLSGCAASFAEENGMDLHQFLFSRGRAGWDAAEVEL